MSQVDRIPYTDFGGNGKKMVFLHGNGFPPESYAPLLRLLAQRYQVLGMHTRTMWQAEVPSDMLSWRIFSDDITRFIRENQLEDAILVGHSFGGLTALRTLQTHPELHNQLVMIDPVMVTPLRLLQLYIADLRQSSTLSKRLHAGALRRRRIFSSVSEAVKAYTGKPIFRRFSQVQLTAFITGLLKPEEDHFTLRIPPEWEAKIYSTAIYRDLDIFLRIPFFPRRSLVVWGTESDTFRKDAVNFLRFINANFVIEPIPQATHLVPFEEPEKTAALILDFLSENK